MGDMSSIPGQEDPLEEEMATHSSTLAWEIPWTEEPSGLQSMGSQRVGHNRACAHSMLYMQEKMLLLKWNYCMGVKNERRKLTVQIDAL